MGGFVYFERTEGVRNWDLLRFSDFPEGLSTEGEDANLQIRSYLTDQDGDCIPVYEFSGTTDEANKLLLFQAEQNPEGSQDGNVLKLIEERLPDGRVGVSPGEMSIDEDGQFTMSPTDFIFQGMTYNELLAGLSEALLNEHHDITPVSPCTELAENQPLNPVSTEQATLTTVKM